MKRPFLEASLRPLKPFQRRTVEHAFHQLFVAENGTGRFLVADEVGLGKMLVARGIIARAIDHLLISDLRRLLAGACVKALEPDLVILDEFQRFKSLLGTQGAERDAAADLAQELFQAAAHDGKRVRTLLLSATPYKLYTADAEIEHEEHYADFLATTRFLLGDDDARVGELQGNCRVSGQRCGARRPESRTRRNASSGRNARSKTPCGA